MSEAIVQQWWTPDQFALVKQDLAQPHFRRSTLMRAMRRFQGNKHYAKRTGIPFPMPTFHEWWTSCWQHHEWKNRASLTKWREQQGVELTQAIVRELLDYSPETGALLWCERDRRWFGSDRIWKTWNARFAGQPAGTLSGDYGYLHVRRSPGADVSGHRRGSCRGRKCVRGSPAGRRGAPVGFHCRRAFDQENDEAGPSSSASPGNL
jgi:hypothetical protein